MPSHLVRRCSLLISLALTAAASAAEVQLGLSPHVSLPPDLPAYSEDSISFYSTNIYFLESPLLRQRTDAALGHPAPAALKIHAERIPNTSILAVTATGAEESVAATYLAALAEQFVQFRRDQKKKFYGDTIARVEATLRSSPPEAAPQIEKYRAQLVVASLLDTGSDFTRLDQK